MGRIGMDGPLAPGARNWDPKVPIKLINSADAGTGIGETASFYRHATPKSAEAKP